MVAKRPATATPRARSRCFTGHAVTASCRPGARASSHTQRGGQAQVSVPAGRAERRPASRVRRTFGCVCTCARVLTRALTRVLKSDTGRPVLATLRAPASRPRAPYTAGSTRRTELCGPHRPAPGARRPPGPRPPHRGSPCDQNTRRVHGPSGAKGPGERRAWGLCRVASGSARRARRWRPAAPDSHTGAAPGARCPLLGRPGSPLRPPRPLPGARQASRCDAHASSTLRSPARFYPRPCHFCPPREPRDSPLAIPDTSHALARKSARRSGPLGFKAARSLRKELASRGNEATQSRFPRDGAGSCRVTDQLTGLNGSGRSEPLLSCGFGHARLSTPRPRRGRIPSTWGDFTNDFCGKQQPDSDAGPR